MNTANWLQDFVTWVITLRLGIDTNELTHEDRERLIVALEQCVCHKPLLKRYLSVLQVALNGNSRKSPPMALGEAARLANERVAVLNNHDLISLALDPVSMWTLHDAVCEALPEWWTDRVIEADEQFLKLGPVMEKTSQPGTAEFPWDKLDLVSRESVSALLNAGEMVPLRQWTSKTTIPCGRGAATQASVMPKPQGLLAADGSAAPRWTWLDDLRAWLLAIPEATWKLAPAMSDDATDFEAVIETPPTVRESCPWANALKIHRSAAVLTIQALGPKTPGSKSSLKVWIAEKPEQAEVLANDQRVGFLDTSEGEPRLLLAVGREEQLS